jgi:hypothetical protein
MRPKSDIQVGDLWEEKLSGLNWNPIELGKPKVNSIMYAHNAHEVRLVTHDVVEFCCIKNRVGVTGLVWSLKISDLMTWPMRRIGPQSHSSQLLYR